MVCNDDANDAALTHTRDIKERARSVTTTDCWVMRQQDALQKMANCMMMRQFTFCTRYKYRYPHPPVALSPCLLTHLIASHNFSSLSPSLDVTQPRVTKQALLPPPHYGTRLHIFFHREKTSSGLSSVIDLH